MGVTGAVAISSTRTVSLLSQHWSADGCHDLNRLYARSIGEETFMSVVYPLFMQHDLRRSDVRWIIGRGLEATRGHYTTLNRLFNGSDEHYKRFTNFLRNYELNLDFHLFREVH